MPKSIAHIIYAYTSILYIYIDIHIYRAIRTDVHSPSYSYSHVLSYDNENGHTEIKYTDKQSNNDIWVVVKDRVSFVWAPRLLFAAIRVETHTHTHIYIYI